MAKSYIYREGQSPNTRLLNTLKVKIFAIDENGGLQTQIGLVQSWAPNHSRTLTPTRGIGFGDQVAEIGVGVTEITASAEVIGMYLKNIMQVFGYKADAAGWVRSLKHHKWPFDVREEIVVPTFINGESTNGLSGGSIITWYEGCWMSSWSHTFAIGDVNVSQTAELQVTDIFDHNLTGNPKAGDAEGVAKGQQSYLFSATA